MNFEQIEELPGVTGHTLISCGGAYLRAFQKFRWTWETVKEGKNHLRGEIFTGRGDTYNEAAIQGLLTYWEMITYRKQQG